jgi:hypothetical protein
MLQTYFTAYLSDNKFKSFQVAAENYCAYLENLNNRDRIDFAIELRKLLADLYSSALQLPKVDLIIDSNYEDQKLRETIKKRSGKIGLIASDILGDAQFYRKAHLPSDQNTEQLSHGFLVDDIQDIYIDIKEPLEFININSDEAVQQALWDFEFGRQSHWGEHCVSALHYIHYLC